MFLVTVAPSLHRPPFLERLERLRPAGHDALLALPTLRRPPPDALPHRRTRAQVDFDTDRLAGLRLTVHHLPPVGRRVHECEAAAAGREGRGHVHGAGPNERGSPLVSDTSIRTLPVTSDSRSW